MLPTPATILESMMKALIEALRPRALLQSASPVNSPESGSTARPLRSLWRAGSSAVKSRQPKRRGSLKRRHCPESSTRSTWSWASGGEAASRMRRLPDMPRCRISVPASVPTRRYFARRPTERMRAPASFAGSPRGTRQRRRGSRTTSRSTRRPTSQGSMPRRVVSTSGSSGIPCAASELRPELDEVPARLVDEARQVVEVEAADGLDLVRDVAAVDRDFLLPAVPVVREPEPSLEEVLARELRRLVQEEVDLAAVRPVRVNVELAVRDGHAPARREVHDGLGRLREAIAVDADGARHRAYGIEDRATAAAGLDREVGVVDLGVVPAPADRHEEVVGEVGLEVELDALAVRLVRVQQGVEVRAAADGRQLLVVHLVLVDGEREAGAVAEVRLDARLVGDDV